MPWITAFGVFWASQTESRELENVTEFDNMCGAWRWTTLYGTPANTGTFPERSLNVRFWFAERSPGTFWER